MRSRALSAIRQWLPRVALVAALSVPVIVTRMSTAGFSPHEVRTYVEIDGVNYGTFDRIDGLDGSSINTEDDAAPFKRITLKRDFVTDPSLYLWAKNIMHGRSDLKDVHVVVEGQGGEELTRYVLHYCQPLSWSVEAANPAVGGFHEKIDLAVQEISVQ